MCRKCKQGDDSCVWKRKNRPLVNIELDKVYFFFTRKKECLILFHFLLSLLIVIIISQLFGALAKVIGQPKVVGEMIGGILVGPSFLGAMFPEIQDWLFNTDIKEQLYLLSQLGISLYMFLIGIHVRNEKMENSLLRNAVQLALVGIIPTFIMTFALCWSIYPSLEQKITTQLIYSLFMSASISVTAFPVLVRILDQQKMIKTKLGRFVVFGASIDDCHRMDHATNYPFYC